MDGFTLRRGTNRKGNRNAVLLTAQFDMALDGGTGREVVFTGTKGESHEELMAIATKWLYDRVQATNREYVAGMGGVAKLPQLVPPKRRSVDARRDDE